MQVTISRWGNSLALRLPKFVTEEVKLVEGESVKIEIDDGSIRVTPTRKRFKLADLLKGETRKDAKREYDWGKPKGEEVW